MQLKEIMTRKVEVVSPDANLNEAAKQMNSLDIGALPVCHHDRLVGIVTDRDIVVRALAEGREPRSTSVAQIMTSPIQYAFEDQPITEAAKIMEDIQIRRLPILNRDMRLVGIVSLGDIAIETRDSRIAAEALERISEPEETATHARTDAPRPPHEWQGSWRRPMHVDEDSFDRLTVARMTDHNVRGTNSKKEKVGIKRKKSA